MDVMVCGSAKVEEYKPQFESVISGFGCNPQFFCIYRSV